jgi:hypothetical protein
MAPREAPGAVGAPDAWMALAAQPASNGALVTATSLPEIRYTNVSALKVAIAEWHRQEFERAEDAYSVDDFFRVQFLDAFGHSDGVFLQLAAAFDAFACAIAHKVGLSQPHKADFASWNASLATKTGGDLGNLIKSTAADSGFDRLMSYRNLAAHRSLTTARTVLRTNEVTDRNEVRFTIGDPPPIGVPDSGNTLVREILARDLGWARDALYVLYPVALSAWGLTGHEQLRGDLGLRGPNTTTPSMTDREVHILVTDDDLVDEND